MSVPTTYAEPKGLFLLEAMACGVPVVQPWHGAFPEILEKTGGGVLVEPHNPKSVTEGLLRLISEPELADKLGRNGFEGVRRYYTAAQMADRALDAYEAVMNGN
jgi:glycosyltransferase involved in cell wall biosynthesis